jgi:DNA polymerase III epsilon subunit family exonuclease
MLDQLKDKTFVIFDTETTGLDYRSGNQIIEIAGQKMVNGVVVEEFQGLINPTCPIEDGAYRVHGISNLYLAEHGKSAGEVLPQFIAYVGDAVVVGHNILNFDIPFLNNNLQNIGSPILNNMLIDTLIMSRKLLPGLPNHKLGTVATHFGVDYAGAHRAMRDVEINRQVFMKMLDQYLQTLAREDEMKRQSQANHSLL